MGVFIIAILVHYLIDKEVQSNDQLVSLLHSEFLDLMADLMSFLYKLLWLQVAFIQKKKKCI